MYLLLRYSFLAIYSDTLQFIIHIVRKTCKFLKFKLQKGYSGLAASIKLSILLVQILD